MLQSETICCKHSKQVCKTESVAETVTILFFSAKTETSAMHPRWLVMLWPAAEVHVIHVVVDHRTISEARRITTLYVRVPVGRSVMLWMDFLGERKVAVVNRRSICRASRQAAALTAQIMNYYTWLTAWCQLGLALPGWAPVASGHAVCYCCCCCGRWRSW